MVEFDTVQVEDLKRGYPRFSVDGQWEVTLPIYPMVYSNVARVYIEEENIPASAVGQLETLIEAVKNADDKKVGAYLGNGVSIYTMERKIVLCTEESLTKLHLSLIHI